MSPSGSADSNKTSSYSYLISLGKGEAISSVFDDIANPEQKQKVKQTVLVYKSQKACQIDGNGFISTFCPARSSLESNVTV